MLFKQFHKMLPLNGTRTPSVFYFMHHSNILNNRNMAFLKASRRTTSPKKTVDHSTPNNELKTKILREEGTIQNLSDHVEEEKIASYFEQTGRFTELLNPEERVMIKKKNKIEEETQTVSSPPNSHLLRVALFGNPNAGKSTLINRIIKQKASAVSKKAQTTRKRVLGVLTEENTQIVLYDTPGILSDKRLKDIARRHRDEQEIEELIEEAVGPIEDSDIIIVIVDATKPLDEIDHLLERLAQRIADNEDEEESEQDLGARKKKSRSKPERRKLELVCALNKTDMIDPIDKVYAIRDELIERTGDKLFSEVFCISADTGNGVDSLVDYLKHRSVPSSWMYKPAENAVGLVPHMSARSRIEEVVREKLYRRLNKELPYHITLQTKDFQLRPQGTGHDLSIAIDMRVNTVGQKKILVSALKDIHRYAITDLKLMYSNVNVYLSFDVQSRDDIERAIVSHRQLRESNRRKK